MARAKAVREGQAQQVMQGDDVDSSGLYLDFTNWNVQPGTDIPDMGVTDDALYWSDWNKVVEDVNDYFERENEADWNFNIDWPGS